MANEIINEQTYPARVITVDWGLIAIGVLGLVLLITVAALLWRGRKRRRPSKNKSHQLTYQCPYRERLLSGGKRPP
jgi:hypothetical protein